MTGQNTDPPTSSDERELRQFGYSQQLQRTMGGFSSFAISFSLISIITGIFANYSFGIQQVGGWLIWSWALVGAGQFLVALVMADLSVRFPISGYGYQWSSRLTNAHLGYFVGWLLLMQFLSGFPGVCQALADTVYGMLGGGRGGWAVTGITVAVISLITLIHIFGIRMVAIVNNVGVYAELLGAAFLILFLGGAWLLAGQFDFSNLVANRNAATGQPAGFSAFALSLLVGAWCLTGFEAAADLAEETRQPRRIVPRAVITSQVSAAVGGFLLLVVFLLSTGDLAAAQASANPLVDLLEARLGNAGMSLMGLVVALSIFACGVASMATATRLIYSLARDNMLPFSAFLKTVNPAFRTPGRAALLVWLLGCLFVIGVRRLELITNISAVAGYLGYAGILAATLLSRREQANVGGFSLGRWRRPVRWVALAWTLGVVAALTIPETVVEGIANPHLPASSTLLALLAGMVLYFGLIRGRIRRGEAGPPPEG